MTTALGILLKNVCFEILAIYPENPSAILQIFLRQIIAAISLAIPSGMSHLRECLSFEILVRSSLEILPGKSPRIPSRISTGIVIVFLEFIF